ncbi:MAG: hypothetical protein ACYC5M_04985 [Anaerolineae bacterium]
MSTIAAVTPATQSMSSTGTPLPLPTEAPPTQTPSTALETTEPTVASATASPTQEGPRAPELLAPADAETGNLLELVWAWDRELSADEWFELQIWPDADDAEPQVFAWSGEPRLRLTGARLLPGNYRWCVTVVRGAGAEREEPVSPTSEVWRFTVTRSSTVKTTSGTPELVPTPTSTRASEPT